MHCRFLGNADSIAESNRTTIESVFPLIFSIDKRPQGGVVYGCLVPGAWCLVPGAWCLVTKRLGDISFSYRHFERSEKSLSFAARVLCFSHMCRALLRFPHLSFMPPVPYPPLRGTFPARGRLRYEKTCYRETFGHRLIYLRRSRHHNPEP